jgi:AbrB family looped-hinge helix DNA binding protein
MRRGDMIRVSSKGQIVLPKQCRENLNIKEGDYVRVREVDDGILLLEKVKASRLDTIVAGLRADVKRQKFTRANLDTLIEDIRAGRYPDNETDGA